MTKPRVAVVAQDAAKRDIEGELLRDVAEAATERVALLAVVVAIAKAQRVLARGEVLEPPMPRNLVWSYVGGVGPVLLAKPSVRMKPALRWHPYWMMLVLDMYCAPM